VFNGFSTCNIYKYNDTIYVNFVNTGELFHIFAAKTNRMEYIDRELESRILNVSKPNKVTIILGARRVGKTILLKKLVEKSDKQSVYLNAEDFYVKEMLKERSISNYKRQFSGVERIFIDEAQTIQEIGLILKLIVDEIEGIEVIATGSSAFDLLNRFGDPLTGRSFTYYLFPFSQKELSRKESPLQTRQNLHERLLFGSYPEVVLYGTNEQKKEYLQNLINTYLLKDIMSIDGLRGASKMTDLLQLIAFQIGNEVSPFELSQHLGISKNTVDKYLDLLSKVFIIFKLTGFSKNLRKEISKGQKWYFFDNGVRNTIISDFKPLNLRNDIGALWENYILSERYKRNHNRREFNKMYFWRTYDQQEIDLVEVNEGKTDAYEVKWNPIKKISSPKAWSNHYADSGFNVIHPENYLEFIV
jgi:predicted AAA+ superfamily ATPase